MLLKDQKYMKAHVPILQIHPKRSNLFKDDFFMQYIVLLDSSEWSNTLSKVKQNYACEVRKFVLFSSMHSLIKMVHQFAKQSGYSPTWAQIVHSVRRNFGGSSNADDQVDIFKKQPILSTLSNMEVSLLFLS